MSALFIPDYLFSATTNEQKTIDYPPRPSSTMLEADIEDLLGMVGMPKDQTRKMAHSDFVNLKEEMTALTASNEYFTNDFVSDWLNDAAATVSRASNNPSPGAAMFSNSPSPSLELGGMMNSSYISHTAAKPCIPRKTSMPIMPRPVSAATGLPSPSPEFGFSTSPDNRMFLNRNASSTPELIPRSQSCSPLLRPYQLSPENFLFSPYISSPMSRGLHLPDGQIDYTLAQHGLQVVRRRNLGVRTKMITPQQKEGTRKNQKIMKEENASCMTCHTEFATLILHGTVEALDSHYQIAMNCVDCEHKQRLKMGEPKRRTTSVDCDCCRRKVAVGGAKVQSLKDPNNWIDPSFGVEVICVSCRDKYGFCTECGGGNRFRTGKWRPLELFEEMRRTCKFSHTRIGKTPVRYQTFHVSTDFSKENYQCVHGYGCSGCSFESVLKELKDMYFDRKLFAYAVPIIMETCPSTLTWDLLNQKILEHWMVVEDYLVTPAPLNKRRYLDLAFITPPARRRKGKSNKDLVVGPSTDQMIAGFVCGEWDMDLSTFLVAQRCNRGVGGDPCSMVLEMSKNLVSRAIADSSVLMTGSVMNPLPLHVYTSGFTRFTAKSTLDYQKSNDRADLREDMEYTISDFSYGRLGFLIVDEYTKKNAVGPRVVEAMMPKSDDDTVFAVSLRDLMATSLVTTSVGTSSGQYTVDANAANKRQKL